MPTHAFDIDALNEICVSLGGNGGHRLQVDALNEWCSKAGKATGHTRSITAYNALAGETSYAFDIQAMNDLSGDLGGATTAISGITALNGIADMVGGAPVGPTELAFADFVNGVYRLNGATATVNDLFVEDSEEWSSFDPATHITADGLIGDPIIVPSLAASWLGTGFTVVLDVTPIPGESIAGSANIECFNPPDWTGDWLVTPVWKIESEAMMSRIQATDNAYSDLVYTDAVSPAPYRCAATLSPGTGHLAMSINGAAVIQITKPDPVEVLTTAIGISISNIAIANMTFRPSQPDAALPGLSV